jgi:hypothetical protein
VGNLRLPCSVAIEIYVYTSKQAKEKSEAALFYRFSSIESRRFLEIWKLSGAGGVISLLISLSFYLGGV